MRIGPTVHGICRGPCLSSAVFRAKWLQGLNTVYAVVLGCHLPQAGTKTRGHEIAVCLDHKW